MRVIFRCDAGSAVGLGHLARCAALASWFDRDADEVTFVVAGDAEGRGALAAMWPDAICLSLDASANEERDWWSRFGPAADVVVFDISHAMRIADRAAMKTLLRSVGGGRPCRVVLDGIGAQTLVDDDSWSVDATIVPYAGPAASASAVPRLVGADYFILPKEWSRQAPHDGRAPVRRLLVTMGGSDPRRLTLLALDALATAAAPGVDVRVVIGPAFNREFAASIRRRAAESPGIEIIEAPADLRTHLGWADLAIAATGLTKYELAWAGVPSVQISLDRTHAELNRSFAAAGTALHLGVADDVDAGDVAAAVIELSGSPERRAEMGRRGRALIDGMGGGRVTAAIRGFVDARA